jgi:SOS-response transcriptional repressor LexA
VNFQMKTYSQLLKDAIEESGLTLDKIVERCKKKGLDIHATYISKLRTGKALPPSPEITQTLAEVIGFDANKLIWQGFIDRSPDEIKDFLGAIDQKIVKLFFTLQDGSITREKFQTLLSENLLNVDQAKVVTHEPSELLESYILNDKAEPSDVNRIEIMGVLSTEPVDRIRTDFEGFEYVSPNALQGKNGFALKIQGDGMANHSIFNGDRVIIAVTDEYSPSDIVYVRTDESSVALCKLKQHNGMCVIIPLNANMEVTFTPKDKVTVLGKVVEVRRTFK